MNPSRKLQLVVAAFAGATLAPAQSLPARPPAAAWLDSISVSASAAATTVDNISRTSYAPTRKDATTCELGLSASRHDQPAANWLLESGAGIDWLAVPQYDLTDNFRAGLRLALQHKFGLGPLAPVLQFDTGLTYKGARLAADRGWTTEAGLRLAKRLDPALKVAVSGQWLEHNAASATFDLQQRTLSLEAAWDITEKWRLSGSASRLSGRIVANAAWPVWGQAISGAFGSTVTNYYNSIPWEVTNLYGPGWVSYNVAATANLWSLTLAYAVSDHSTLELRTSQAYVINHIDVRYPTESWGLGFIHRF
jgi:hypothetical protein